MKNWLIAPILMAFLLWSPLAHGARGDGIIGFWSTQNRNTRFQIYKCGSLYCGKISYMREPDHSANNREGLAGQPKRDVHNPDPLLRDRTLLGLPLLERFRYEGHNLWDGGTIYDPDDGHKYSCKIWLDGKRYLKLRGYMGISLFGRTETWVSSNH